MAKENNELVLVIKEAGVSEKKALEILQTVEALAERSSEWDEMAKISIEDPEDKATMKLARENRLAIKKDRGEAEKFIKAKRTEVQEKMAEFTAEDKAYLKLFQYFEKKAKQNEAYLQEIEDYAAKIEAERIAALKEERLKKLADVCENPEIYPVETMSDQAFDTMYDSMLKAKKMREQEEKEAEEQRRLAEEAEAKRKAAEGIMLSRRLTLSKFEVVAPGIAEQITVDTTEQEYEELLKAATKKKNAWDEEQLKLRQEQERLRLENEEKDRQLEAARKAQAEAQRKAEEEEAARRAQAERQAKLGPVQRATEWVGEFKAPVFELTEHEDVERVRQEILEKFQSFKKWAKAEFGKL